MIHKGQLVPPQVDSHIKLASPELKGQFAREIDAAFTTSPWSLS